MTLFKQVFHRRHNLHISKIGCLKGTRDQDATVTVLTEDHSEPHSKDSRWIEFKLEAC